MTSSFTHSRSAVPTAMLCAGGLTALFVAGKATRDALYLANLEVTSLPPIVAATAVVSICLVALSSKVLRHLTPATFVPLLFVASAFLLLGEWFLVYVAPRAAAVIVYLQISGVGPMLGSGFWLIATEEFDPHTAKKRFGQIAAVGTLGGLLGGLSAERIGSIFGVAAMLPVMAGVTLICAWQVRRLASGSDTRRFRAPRHNVLASDAIPHAIPGEDTPALTAAPARSGLRVLREAPYLRRLALLVLFGTTSAALIDYVFKAQSVASFGTGEDLLRFFAWFYAVVSLVTFVLQTSASMFVLKKLGLASATGAPSVAVLAGGIGGLIAPGLGSAVAARGGESIFRAAFFRSGYELFYTPIGASEKRPAKSLLDVAVDRIGEAAGGGIVQLVLVFAPLQASSALLSAAIGLSTLALIVAARLPGEYRKALERRIVIEGGKLDLPDDEDVSTRTMMLRTLGMSAERLLHPPGATVSTEAHSDPVTLDPEARTVLALRSRDRSRVLRALKTADPLPATLVPHAIPLLAWDELAPAAIGTLRHVADQHTGQLTDALLDPNQPFAVRRRLPRVFSACTSQRAADGLLLGLADQRFEVRFQCGRSLAAIVKANPEIKIEQEHVYGIVLREVTVGRPVWESRRLLDQPDDQSEHSFVDEFVKVRTSQGLAHIFTLLSLVLPTEPLQIAYRGLHTDDDWVRGLALEYLEEVLPPVVRDRLWPFLDDPRPTARPPRARGEILEDLLRSNASIVLNLAELKEKSRK